MSGPNPMAAKIEGMRNGFDGMPAEICGVSWFITDPGTGEIIERRDLSREFRPCQDDDRDRFLAALDDQLGAPRSATGRLVLLAEPIFLALRDKGCPLASPEGFIYEHGQDRDWVVFPMQGGGRVFRWVDDKDRTLI